MTWYCDGVCISFSPSQDRPIPATEKKHTQIHQLGVKHSLKFRSPQNTTADLSFKSFALFKPLIPPKHIIRAERAAAAANHNRARTRERNLLSRVFGKVVRMSLGVS